MQLYPPFQNRACGTREKPSIGPLVTGTPAPNAAGWGVPDRYEDEARDLRRRSSYYRMMTATP